MSHKRRHAWRASSWARWWALALAVVLGCSGCGTADRRIELPPLPPRDGDAATAADDAGTEPPDGATRCVTDKDCDDGLACTQESCVRPGYCLRIGDSARCDDGVFCNGFEVCDPKVGCRSGPRESCNDDDACTIDSCDEARKVCVHGPRDFDHDGEIDDHCPGGTDCDDFDPARGRRDAELCADQIDNDCDGVVDEQPCGRPAHDTCADALDISAGGSFEVQLAGAAADYAVSCTAAAARDVVFTFVLKQARDVKLMASSTLGDGSEENAVLALQSSCGDRGAELDCRVGFPADLRRRALPAGRYFVVASGFAAKTLSLRASFSAPTVAPTNTRCPAARDVSAGGTFTGDFVGVTDVAASSCGVSGQPDLFYSFTLRKPQDVEIAALSEETGRLTLSVVSSCATSASEQRCESGDPAQARLHQLPAGHYVLRLEGPASRAVSFSLNVAFLPPTAPPPGDDCAQPLPLTAGKAVSVNLADLRDSVDTSCQLMTKDAVFQLTLDKPSDLDIQLDASAATAVVALQKTCGVPSSELSCRLGRPAQTRVRDVAAGTYFVVVEAPAAQSADLKVDALPASHPVAVSGNTSCAKGWKIPATGGLFVGSTLHMADSYHGSCGGGSTSGDAVFGLQLTQAQHVVARIDSGFDSVLYRYSDARTGSAACTDLPPGACDDDSAGNRQAQLDEMLDPGTYYYVVDGFKSGNQGPYLLDVTVTGK
ncbi:MAG TPA: putative metal-binding motif-containing protein [Polyangiales bacterium]